MKKIISLAIISLYIFAGCKLSTETVPPPALARFVHASPDAGNIDVLLNGALLAENFPLAKDTAVTVFPAITNFMVSKTGSGSSLINTNFTLDPLKAYSIFAIGNVSAIKATITQDEFTLPTTDSVKIRFFHFSPNAGNVNAVFTNATDTLTYTNRGFNDQESISGNQVFAKHKAGIYKLELFPIGSSIPLASINGISFTGGNVYTFFLKGNYGASGEQALGLGTVWHNR